MTQHGLTLAQQAAMHKAQKQGPVVTLPVVTADALIRMGYMRHTVITPTPEKGKAVSLTTKGLTWLRNRSS
jgi:hypothetical protein